MTLAIAKITLITVYLKFHEVLKLILLIDRMDLLKFSNVSFGWNGDCNGFG